MGKEFIFVLMSILMLGLVAGAGYNIVVPSASPSSPSSSSGGGGGGSSSSGFTYSVSAVQLAAGYSRELGVGDRFKVNVSNELHYVKLVGVTATTVSINVSSVTQEATLALGDVRMFDVSGDGRYDLSVMVSFVNVTSSKATFMVKSIDEEVTEETVSVEDGLEEDAVREAEGGSSSWWIWVVVLIVVVVGAGVIYYLKKKNSY